MNVNEKLANLYNSKWNGLCKALNENGLVGYEYNPLLLYIKDVLDFENADIRVMFFGQDMSDGDWYNYNRYSDVLTECMPAYKTFDNKIGSIDTNGHRMTKGMGGGMNLFIKYFNSKFQGKNVRYVWDDIVKIGRNTRSNQYRDILKEIEKSEFDVLREEIKIIQPQILIFFTGPDFYWEDILQKRIGITANEYREFCNWNIRQVAQIDTSKCDFPFVKYAFRTYHPCARGSKKARYNSIIDGIDL